jgi:glycosyltransferase involved in cell wall biosynthesis
MKMFNYKITIFTPTFNRGYLLGNLYESLKRQTVMDFEWIVIDDGSTDNTSALFESWKNQNDTFPIIYFNVKNGGKHRAINKGVELARGELFFIVDSDDYLVDDAVARVITWESTIRDLKHLYAGISGNRGYGINELIGKTFDGEYVDATSLERIQYNIHGDKVEIFYTHILKKYKFPEFEGETFLTENIVWNKIAYEGYKIRWFNQIIYICNYLDDGLTKAGTNIFLKNPKGLGLSLKQQILHNRLSLKGRMQLWCGYYLLFRNKLSIVEISKHLGINRFVLLLTVWAWKVKIIFKRHRHAD